MARPVPVYAQRLLVELRKDTQATVSATPPPVQTTEVIKMDPEVVLKVVGQLTQYSEDDLQWHFDPATLELADIVTIIRDETGQPIATGIASGEQQSPLDHPDGAAIQQSVTDLSSEVQNWRSPVSTVADLPTAQNRNGDVRLVLANEELYRWKDDVTSWIEISSAGSGDDPTKLPLTGGTLTGALEISSGDLTVDAGNIVVSAGDITVGTGNVIIGAGDLSATAGDISIASGYSITIPDAPVNPTDGVNKAYVDSVAAGIVASGAIPTVSTSTNYTALTTDETILVYSGGGSVTVSLPATHPNGKIYEVKDAGGSAAIHSITIDTVDSSTIDGLSTYTMVTDYQAIGLITDGTNWFIF